MVIFIAAARYLLEGINRHTCSVRHNQELLVETVVVIIGNAMAVGTASAAGCVISSFVALQSKALSFSAGYCLKGEVARTVAVAHDGRY